MCIKNKIDSQSKLDKFLQEQHYSILDYIRFLNKIMNINEDLLFKEIKFKIYDKNDNIINRNITKEDVDSFFKNYKDYNIDVFLTLIFMVKIDKTLKVNSFKELIFCYQQKYINNDSSNSLWILQELIYIVLCKKLKYIYYKLDSLHIKDKKWKIKKKKQNLKNLTRYEKISYTDKEILLFNNCFYYQLSNNKDYKFWPEFKNINKDIKIDKFIKYIVDILNEDLINININFKNIYESKKNLTNDEYFKMYNIKQNDFVLLISDRSKFDIDKIMPVIIKININSKKNLLNNCIEYIKSSCKDGSIMELINFDFFIIFYIILLDKLTKYINNIRCLKKNH